MRTLLIAAALLAASPAVAADWTIDPTKSHLGFTGTQTGKPFTGSFGTFAGTISFDPANPAAGHATVTIDTASAKTGDPQKDEALPGADWFAASKFPRATFEASGFRATGGDAYEAAGTLSIRDAKQDAVLPFTLKIDGSTAHATGRMQLIRTRFGVGQGSWTSGKWVALEVAVDVDVVATKK